MCGAFVSRFIHCSPQLWVGSCHPFLWMRKRVQNCSASCPGSHGYYVLTQGFEPKCLVSRVSCVVISISGGSEWGEDGRMVLWGKRGLWVDARWARGPLPVLPGGDTWTPAVSLGECTFPSSLLEKQKKVVVGFPGGSVVKNHLANTGDMGSIPGSGRSPGEGNGNPLQYS